MARKVPKLPERLAMYELIKEHSTEDDDETGTRFWDEGWNWDRVAKAVHKDFQAWHSKGVARDMGIGVFEARPKSEIQRLTDRVAQLEDLVKALETRVSHLLDEDE